ncbi:MAG: aromatic acid exporter family protein [Gaiellaceae bacterium]
MNLPARLDRVRWRFDPAGLGRIAQAALAAGLAWQLARLIPGHGEPFFAPIAAVIALGAEGGRRGRQAVEMMFGVALGILIGATVVVAVGAGGWQIVVAVAFALLLGTALGARPMTVSESAVSAILIVGLQRTGSNYAYQRLFDALIGGGIAIVTAQVLFPIDPLDLVRRESQRLRGELGRTLDEVAEALRARDRERAEGILAMVDAIDERRLHDALALARDVARRAPRRRAARRRLEPIGDLVASLDAAVGDTRALVTGALRALDSTGAPPKEVLDAIGALATAIRTTNPAVARRSADRALRAGLAAHGRDDSLGMSVLTHAIASIADDVNGSARAREAEQRVHVSRLRRFRFVERRSTTTPEGEQP